MALAIDVNTSANKTQARAISVSIASPSFSTASAGELLLACIAAYPNTGGRTTTVSSVTGGGLIWTKATSANGSDGGSEIWYAWAASVLTSVSVTAVAGDGGNVEMVGGQITILSYTGADATSGDGSSAIGATATGGSGSGAPSINLTTTRAGSYVVGTGNDWDNSTARTVISGQSMVHEFRDTGSGDDSWVQRTTTTVASSGTVVNVKDTAPTADQWNLCAVEVLAATGGGGGPAPSQYLCLLGVGS